jgi:hypothetical protein
VKDENGDLLANSHNILNRWMNYYSQLLNVRRVSHVRQKYVQMSHYYLTLVSPFEDEIAIAKLKRYKSPDSDKFRQNLFKQEVKHYGLISINSLILFGIRKNCFCQWKESIAVPLYKKDNRTDCSNY